MKLRSYLLGKIRDRLIDVPIVVLLGPRQVGKTTLARQLDALTFYDLENPQDEVLLENPALCFEGKRGVIVIDEVQRKQSLFPFLRYWVDSHPEQRFLLLGSASSELVNQTSESLAGRISFIEVSGFGWDEIDLSVEWQALWQRGAYPRSFLASSDASSYQWRMDYVRTFLERDLPQLGIRLPAPELRRFWVLLAHANGQLLNYSELGRIFGLSDVATRRYVEVLQAALVLRCLRPWHENISKRQVRKPKLYLRDTGIVHSLMGVSDILSHPALGASWESFVIEHLINYLVSHVPMVSAESFYFWRSHVGEEIDLFFELDGKRYGFEVKYSAKVQVTSAMRAAQRILGLEKIFIMVPRGEVQWLDEGTLRMPLNKIGGLLPLLGGSYE